MIQPSNIKNGMTNNAIWILDPTATVIAKSSLFFTDTVTAVTC